MNSFERALRQRIANEVDDLSAITPGIVIDVHVRGRRKGLVRTGDTYEFYDLASLTKIIFTASCAIQYFSTHPRELRQPVRRVLPWWTARSRPVDFLSHTAGMDWWLPYYKKLRGPMIPQQRWEQLKKLLARRSPKSGRHQAIYSDLDLWMMGSFMEAVTGLGLLPQWEQLAGRLDLDMFFHPGNKPRYARRRYAPTENSPWRGGVMRGEVHDENTWALAGVAPHSGLFGNIEAVSDWGLKLRSAVLKDSPMFGKPAMVRQFVRRFVPRAQGDWGLGFMKPSKGRASCGKYFSADSFGHTGFTGTSLWMDPKQDLLIVILSNRVHPTRDNETFKQLRPRLHEWVCELL